MFNHCFFFLVTHRNENNNIVEEYVEVNRRDELYSDETSETTIRGNKCYKDRRNCDYATKEYPEIIDALISFDEIEDKIHPHFFFDDNKFMYFRKNDISIKPIFKIKSERSVRNGVHNIQKSFRIKKFKELKKPKIGMVKKHNRRKDLSIYQH